MKLLHLLPVGSVDRTLLHDLSGALPRLLPVACDILDPGLDPSPCYHSERQQYHSSEILARIAEVSSSSWRVLGVAGVDLYIPILKYLFGEAQLGGRCALISYHRLRQDFYGLPPDDARLRERLLKESLHELGHTFGLRHCDDYRCVMASAHSVDWIDVRDSALCQACATLASRNYGDASPFCA